MKNSEIIDNPNYYRLPCGKYLEDFIWYRNLNFAWGSALKYLWRAGHKDGEPKEKDMSKCMHYLRSIVKNSNGCFDRVYDEESVRNRLNYLYAEANNWNGVEFYPQWK